jgi:hypothetical protein
MSITNYTVLTEFNPYHDARGRFSSSSKAIFVTLKTKSGEDVSHIAYKNHIIQPVMASLKSSPLGRILHKYPVPIKFMNYIDIGGIRVNGRYDKIDREIHILKRSVKSDNTNSTFQFGKSHSVSSDESRLQDRIKATVFHEVSHHAYFTLKAQADKQGLNSKSGRLLKRVNDLAVSEILNRSASKRDGLVVSLYAKVNVSEWFAETSAAYNIYNTEVKKRLPNAYELISKVLQHLESE